MSELTLKEQFQIELIPSVNMMLEKEKQFLDKLTKVMEKQDNPDMVKMFEIKIAQSAAYISFLNQRLSEYVMFCENLK